MEAAGQAEALAAALAAAAARVVELKKAGADASAVQDAARAGTTVLLRLRQAYRDAALGAEAVRERTAAAKAQLDRVVLQLHNLLYEKVFYEKEIATCRGFRSAYSEEAIGLMPDAEFAAAAEAAGGAAAPADPHDRMLSRLQHELDGRKQLTTVLVATCKERAKEADASAAGKARLESLQASLRGLEQAGRPLATALGPRAELRAQQRAAALLPMPLWVIYSQLSAARDALGLPVEVEIEGAVEEAVRTATTKPGATKGAGRSRPGGVAPPSKRRKEGSAAPEEGGVYHTHPLTVVVSLLSQQQQEQGSGTQQRRYPLQVCFCFYPAPGLVGALAAGSAEGQLAASDDGAAVLGSLFPGDVGDGEGFEALTQVAGPGPYEFGSDTARARPYRWAQDLGGLDVVPSLPPQASAEQRAGCLAGLVVYRGQGRVEVVVERMRAALEAAAALKALVDELLKGRAPATPLDAAVPCAISTKLWSWKRGASSSHPSIAAAAATSVPLRGVGSGSVAPSRQASGGAGGGGRGAAVAVAAAAATVPAATVPAATVPAASAEEGEVADEDVGMAAVDSRPGGAGPVLMQTASTLDEDALLGGLLEDGEAGEVPAGPGAAAAAAAMPTGGAPPQGSTGDGGNGDDAAGGDGGGGGESDGEAAAGAARIAELEAAAASAGTGDAAGAVPVAAYKVVLQSPSLEVRASVVVYRCYPLVPPRWAVKRIAPLSGPSGRAGEPLQSPGYRLWLEREANSEALQWATAAECLPQLLGVQLLRLRWCVDRLGAKLGAAQATSSSGSGGDLLSLLQAKQTLRGPARDPHLVAL